MYSSLNSGFSTLAICKFKKLFLDNYTTLKYGSTLPKSSTTYTNAAKRFGHTVKKWIRESADIFKITKKSYSIQIDAATDTRSEMFAPMVSFNHSMKPLLMDIVNTSTNANSDSVVTITNRRREKYGLDPNLFRYFISDGTAYNISAFDDMEGYYNALHHIISVLHMGTNGMNKGINDCKDPLIILARNCMKNAPMLFSKSHGRRAEFTKYVKRVNSLDEDPLISDLFQTLGFEEVCEMYYIPYKDDKALIHLNIFDDDEVDSMNAELTALYGIDYLKRCCLNTHPPRRITNKWKTTPFSSYYMYNRLRIFCEYCKRLILNEEFFSLLTDLQIRSLLFVFYYMSRKLIKILHFLIKYEGRKAVLQWIYFDTIRLKNLFRRPITAKHVSNELKMLFLDYVNHKCDDEEDDDMKDKILKEDCIKPIEALRKSLLTNFVFQFRTQKSSMGIYSDLWNLNPFNPNIPIDVLDAFPHFKNGVHSLGNQLGKLQQWRIEWRHWTSVIVKYIQNNNKTVMHLINNAINRDNKYTGKIKPNDSNKKEEKIDILEIFDSDYDSTEENTDLITKCVLTQEDQKELRKYALQGLDINIIGLFKCKIFSGYRVLPSFALDVLDHANESVDNERFYSFVAWINQNKLTKSLSEAVKKAKLFTMWNTEIIEHNLHTDLHEFK
eukprot:352865_1